MVGIDINNIDPDAQSQSADSRPKWLPEKFKSAEEMAKAYAELESKLGQRNPETDEAETDDAENKVDDAEAEDPNYDKIKEDLTAKQVDYQEMTTRFWQNGAQLEDTDYETLEKAGYARDLVDQFIEGQKAIVEAQRATVFAVAGGESEYTTMLNWARANFTSEEAADYDEAVNSSRMTKVLSAVRDLKSRFEDANGREPKRTVAGSTSGAASSVYNSVAEMQRDMADPKYKTDPAFRARVAEKLGRSNIM